MNPDKTKPLSNAECPDQPVSSSIFKSSLEAFQLNVSYQLGQKSDFLDGQSVTLKREIFISLG